ncbi:MAG: cysteine--tRNA ligase [Candidatus Pacearchaeota archaeon]
MLKLYNTLTRKKEIFIPLKEKKVGFYTCGPTVYDYAHLGNFRAYICSDILKRYLKFLGYKVKHVMNLTDVDDKTIKRSREEKISLKELTDKYAKAFFDDLKKLNIEYADIFSKATEHIKDMIKHINLLLQKGFAYISQDGSIYYDISKFKDYGKLSGIKVKKLKAGASQRIKKDEYEKEQANDFALWKAWTEEDGDIFWNAEFIVDGNKKIIKGRPGWHIECSVMSTKYLGESFDIHSGGQDLIFPHHENEIAQTEVITGKQFVRYWIHNGWLLVEGKKMSKSLGNFFTLRDLLNENISPRVIRYVLMSINYREPLDFTFEKVKAAEQTLKRIDNFLERLEGIKTKTEVKTADILIKELKEKIIESMNDDLNVVQSFEAIFNFIRDINNLIDKNEISKKQSKEIINLFKELDKIYCVLMPEKIIIPKEIQKLIDEREKARKVKDWKKSDEIREKVKQLGFWINDTLEGPKVTKI